MKKLLALIALATLSIPAVANDNPKVEASQSYAQMQAFDTYCGMFEDVYLNNDGIMHADKLYKRSVDADAFVNVEFVNTQRAIDEDEFGGIVVCVKLKERLKRKGLFYGFFNSYL
tara:strand:+ start:111 stop:455 length:345 start_codon:yes stop_codon:yes gene_type:complete